MKLLTVQLPPFSYYVIPLRSKYSSQKHNKTIKLKVSLTDDNNGELLLQNKQTQSLPLLQVKYI
jgi:hypothetical protein